MGLEHYTLVQNIAKDFELNVSPFRIQRVAEKVNDSTSIDVIVAYLTAAYDNTGPQGLTVKVRFSEYELDQIDLLIDFHNTLFTKVDLRDILIRGIRSSIIKPHDILPPVDEKRVSGKVIRLNRQLEKLIKDSIAFHSTELKEITTTQAILYGLYASIRDMEMNIKYNT